MRKICLVLAKNGRGVSGARGGRGRGRGRGRGVAPATPADGQFPWWELRKARKELATGVK